MQYLKLILLLIVSGCIHPLSKPLLMTFDKQGHRGCRSLLPENTIPAMLKAVELGVTTLEMDVVITKDSQVVLSHEPFFNHEISTKPNGTLVTEREEKGINIYQMNYDEVKMYDVGSRPHPHFPAQQKMKVGKPLLGDVIDSVEALCNMKNIAPVNYNIEIKTLLGTDDIYHPDPAHFVALLMNDIKRKGIEQKVIIQSFDVRPLQYMHEKYPAIKTALLIDKGETRSLDTQLKDLGYTPGVYSPHFSLVTKELVRACHEKKMAIIPWTVNDAGKMKELKRMGVDGIISDDPALFAGL